MNKIFQQCKQRFQDRSPREQRFLTMLAIFMVVIFSYYGIILPQQTAYQQAELQKISSAQLATWMQHAVDKLHQQKRHISNTSQNDLLQNVKLSLQSAAIASKHYTLELHQLDLDISFKQVAFANFARWLQAITKQQILVIRSCQITSSPLPGQVNIKLYLTAD